MTIRIELTRKQMIQLRRHFEVVNTCASMGKDCRGVLAAQVHEDWDGLTGYVRVCFIPSMKSGPVIEAIRSSRIPNCWAGIPSQDAVGADPK